jgi:hypothetical protein
MVTEHAPTRVEQLRGVEIALAPYLGYRWYTFTPSRLAVLLRLETAAGHNIPSVSWVEGRQGDAAIDVDRRRLSELPALPAFAREWASFGTVMRWIIQHGGVTTVTPLSIGLVRVEVTGVFWEGWRHAGCAEDTEIPAATCRALLGALEA